MDKPIIDWDDRIFAIAMLAWALFMGYVTGSIVWIL